MPRKFSDCYGLIGCIKHRVPINDGYLPAGWRRAQ